VSEISAQTAFRHTCAAAKGVDNTALFRNNADIIEMEIMPDHVHMLMEVDPQFGINRAVRSIKGYAY